MKVSVVIPTLDAGPGFEKISTQEGDFEREVLVLDSGSTDGADELARSYGAVRGGSAAGEDGGSHAFDKLNRFLSKGI